MGQLDPPRENRHHPETGQAAQEAVGSGPVRISHGMRWRALLGGMAGNLVEFLDFAIYGLVADTISKLFFAPGDSTAALLNTFLIYAGGFAIRPLGGFLLGRVGDRSGRQRLLAVTVIGMSCATAAIGLLPTYATLGTAAPVLLVICRLVQGFFAGGEYAGATTYMVEFGSPKRHAYWACWSSVSSSLGSIAGIGLFTVVTSSTSASAMESWGWRLLFLIGVPLGVGGAYIRWRLEESPEFRELQRIRAQRRIPARGVVDVLRTQWRQILSFVSFQATESLANYLLIGFFVTYLTVFLHQSPAQASVALLAGRSVQIGTTLAAGWLNDRIGRRITVIVGCAMIIPLVFLVFLVARHATPTSGVIAACLLGMSFSLLSSAMNVGLVEMFPVDVRVTAGSIGYNVGSSLFGGTAPFVATWLMTTFHDPFVVAGYVAAVALASVVSVATSFHPLPRGSADAPSATHRRTP
jgi:MHS family proline/betaine transporter-like MFS transporter